jgi:hypothetical protein
MKITRATIERLIKEELRVILPEIKTSVQSNNTKKYYVAGPKINLQQIINKWQNDGQKLYDNVGPIQIPVQDLIPHREFLWTREKSRGGIARVGNKNIELRGPEKWDAMTIDLKINGWDEKEPLYFDIGRRGGQKVAEGNHRLTIARKIGIETVPVKFSFKSEEVKKDRMESPVMLKPKSVKSAISKTKHKLITPEEEKRVSDLMDLLNF